jgi:hypothetical protein
MTTTHAILRTNAMALVLIAACSGPAPMGTPNGGPPPVVVRTDAASAADCPYGGSVVSSGSDDNDDGVLEDAEVANRSVVCRPAPMLPPEVLVRLVAEPRGKHCSDGGTAVQSGLDDNRNGVLDDGEVTDIAYACGQVLLTRLASEPPGANCSLGGIAFLAGRDRDDDHQLEDGEIEARSFECGDVIARDVPIAREGDLAALADVRIITGALVANFVSLPHGISLPKLEHVGGALRVNGSTGASIALPKLQEVDGAFEITHSASQIDCPQLRRVGSLALTFTRLSDVSGFPALTTVDGSVVIQGNSALTSADLPLASVGGNVAISFNDQLPSLSWKLRGRVGAVDISENARIESIDFSVARRDGAPSQIGPIAIFAATALAQVAVSADRVASLAIDSSRQVADIELDVGSYDSGLSVFGIDAPFHLGLTPAGGDSIAIGGNFLLSSPMLSFDVGAPLTVGDLLVFDHTVLTRFEPGSPVTVRGGLRFTVNPLLTSVAPLTLLPGATLQVTENGALSSLDFLTLPSHQIGGMLISDNPALADAPSLAGVTDVLGGVRVENNAALTALFDGSLQRIEGSLVVRNNAGLRAMRYPLLDHVDSTLLVQDNAALQSLEAPALPEVVDGLSIFRNPQLRHIAFDALTRANSFGVGDNPRLPACEVLAIFAHVTGFGKGQSGNDNTATCGP